MSTTKIRNPSLQLASGTWKRRSGSDLSFDEWITVAIGLKAAREIALKKSGRSTAVGGIYNKAVGDVLRQYELDGIKKGDRSDALKMLINIQDIRNWRESLPPSVRAKMNHPSAILKRWRAAIDPREAIKREIETTRGRLERLQSRLLIISAAPSGGKTMPLHKWMTARKPPRQRPRRLKSREPPD
jgi:hypothetical protein